MHIHTEEAIRHIPGTPSIAWTHILQRDGTQAPFDAERIGSAIARAGQAAGEFTGTTAQSLTEQVLQKLQLSIGQQMPAIEQIQDHVELVLMDAGYFRTARAYIAYREQHSRLRKDRQAVVHAVSSVNEYLAQEDWRVRANANQGYSLGGLILNVAGKVVANYWLSHVYPQEIAAAHREGDIHIHDLDMLAGYCAGWSLRVLLQ